LAKFNFIPAARVDDLMVSLAGDGGGVGPHVDSYDVFLLQGIGSRRWQISRQKDLALERNVPLKILAKFVPEQEWVLEEGDMLYLPPHIAHHGVALGDGKGKGECMTWSIGFRAPNKQELATAFLDFLRDDLALSGAYADRDLEVARTPGLIDAAMERRFAAMLDDVRHAVIDRKVLRRFLGCYLSDPKAHVMFDAPERTLAPAAFARLAKARGLRLDLKTRAFFLGPQLFVNGQATALPPAERAAWKSLTDTRSVAPAALQRVPADPAAPLYASYRAGYLHVQF
jgi:50S ribosomal protein L16 3-hydroxylase